MFIDELVDDGVDEFVDDCDDDDDDEKKTLFKRFTFAPYCPPPPPFDIGDDECGFDEDIGLTKDDKAP